MNRIYISDLHSPLGYHLVDLLRTDHLNPAAPALIIGSSTEPPTPPVFQTLNFSQLPQVCCRAVLDCDLVILSLEHSSHEAELIIRFLENSHSALTKPLRVIGLSSVMTWEGLSPYELQRESEREKIMGAVIDEAAWRRVTWTDKDYQRRIPNNFYVRTYELQNMLLKLNKNSKINASILSHGILYGRQNTTLQKDILASLAGQGLSCFGPGDNIIPLTHIQNLLESLQQLIPQREIVFAVACDSRQYSQRQIKQLLAKATGNLEPLAFKQDLYLVKEQCDWSINLTITSSHHQIQAISNRRCFEKYVQDELLCDFCDYNCYTPKQYLIITDKYEEHDLKELTEELQGYRMILWEEIQRIDQQIIVRMTPPEPEPPAKKLQKNSILKPATAQPERDPVHYYKQAWEAALSNQKYHNFIIVCREALLPFLSSELVHGSLLEILPCESEEHPVEEQAIIFRSDHYYSTFSITKPSNIIPASDHAPQPARDSSQRYQFESSGRKDDQLVLLNQYLLDNVLLPISQAKFAMKTQRKDPTLRNFIEELKGILAKSNSRGGPQNNHCDS